MTFWFRTALAALFVLGGLAAAHGQQRASMPQIPSPSGAFLAGQEAFQDLETGQAARYFLDAAEAEWDNAAIVERAFTALAADGRIEEAADLAQRLLELEPANPLARLTLGTVALKERRYASTVNHLVHLGSDTFIGITGGIVRAWGLVGQDDLDRAFAELDVVADAGLGEFLVFHRALMADLAGDRAAAIRYIAEAYDVDPFVARVVEARARILGNAGRIDEALEVIAEFEAEGFTHPLVDIVGQALEAGTRPGPFAASLQAGAAEMFHGIGTALARDGALDIAMLYMRLGLYLDPANDVLALALGQLLDSVGRHEAANAIYEAVPESSPLRTEAIVFAAQNFDSMDDRAEAIRRLDDIVGDEPANIQALSVLGDMLRFDRQFERAAEIYTLAIEAEDGDRPRDWRYYYVRGISHERAGMWPEAEADFLRALELNPGHPQVLNYLGYSWVDMGLNLEEALELIEEAVDAAPRDGYIVDSLGWAFYKLGRIEEAVEVLEQAVRLEPNNAEINDHLGDAYWRAGRTLEARFQWRIAAYVDREGNVRERVAPKLVDGLPEDEIS